jgi:predicted peptidase
MKNLFLYILFLASVTLINPAKGQPAISNDVQQKRIVPFGSAIDPATQINESKELAHKLANSDARDWKSKGDQRRFYRFPDTGSDMPYRVYVPSSWDAKSKLPLVMFLHGAWNDESSYLDADNKLMLALAEKNRFLLVSPLGYDKLGAYGTSLKLPAVFGKPEEAAKIMSSLTPDRIHTLELSERDVINVLELVLAEYPVDRSSMFLMGHSMGSGGTWYIGAKYNNYWRAIAPMSGPFVEEKLYPWDRIKKIPVFITEGTKSASLESSRQMADWMKEKGFEVSYKEVDADHPGMVPLVLPEVFEFFKKYTSNK